jgi:hypothetical protein
MRIIGHVYAALDPAHDDLMPGLPEHDGLFEGEEVPAAAWTAFEGAQLCEDLHDVPHGGLIGTYEECWFKAPDLPALIAVFERGALSASPELRAWLLQVAAFARRAQARGVGLTFVIGG